MDHEIRKRIIIEAISWKGVKFKKGGRDRTGVDCVGLLVNVGRDCGFEIEDTVQYSFNPEPAKFQHMVFNQTIPADILNLDIGNILLFRQSIYPMHTGLLVKDQYGKFAVLHASLKDRKVVVDPLEDWHELIIGVRDYKG